MNPKILWFTNSRGCYTPIKSSSANLKGYNGGGWISSALQQIKRIAELELAVSFFMDNQPSRVVQDGIYYYPLSNPDKSSLIKRAKKFFNCVTGWNKFGYERALWSVYKAELKNVVDDFQPDLIHVWGTEKEFGLVSSITNIPVVFHIQGILNPCLNAFLPPFFSWRDFKYKSYHPFRLMSNIMNKNLFEMAAYREMEIFKSARYFLGRTEWDKNVVSVLAPQSKYFVVDEILRDVFYENTERKIRTKHRILTTISSPLYKGGDMVLKTAKILKENLGLSFEWCCYGNVDINIIEKRTGIKAGNVNVYFNGIATAEQLRDALASSTLYMHPSYIDNSPNSIYEAQMLAVPVVATYVGGIPSIVRQGVDGYLVPSNDPYQAAYYIKELCQNEELNSRMGEAGKSKAIITHDPIKVVNQILGVYHNILNN